MLHAVVKGEPLAVTFWPKVILLIRKLLHIKTFFLSGTTNMQSSTASSLLTFCLLTGALLIDHASWKGASSSDTYAALRLPPPPPSILCFCFVYTARISHVLLSFIRWCEQDLCPVATKQKQGCYDPGTPALDAALVYDQPNQD